MTAPLSEVFFPSVVVCNINQVRSELPRMESHASASISCRFAILISTRFGTTPRGIAPFNCFSFIAYSARAQAGPQEMERNEATAKHVAWPSCAWLLLSFFPYPVGHPEHEHCTVCENAAFLSKEEERQCSAVILDTKRLSNLNVCPRRAVAER